MVEPAVVVRQATRSRGLVFAGMSLALLMISIDITIVATALDTINTDLHATVDWTAWTLSAYQLGSVTALPIAGRLSDALGRKRMFFIFISIFTGASLLCGLSTNIFELIGFRFIQALGGGGLVPSVTGIVSDLYGSDRDRPIGLMTSIYPLGALIGPAVGGVIVTYFSWRFIFFINIPIGLLLMVLLARLVPADPPVHSGRLRVDVPGAVLLCLSILALMLGIGEIGRPTAPAFAPYALLGTAVVLGAMFFRRQRHASLPILPAVLLKQRAFALVNGINLLYGAGIFGIFSLVPLYAQVSFGMPPLEAGALLAIRAGVMAVMAALTSILVIRRFGYRLPMAVGFVISAAGLIMIATPPQGLSPFGWLALSSTVCGIGVGIAGPPSNNANIQLMPAQIGAIVGLRAMFRQIGGILAISIAATVVGTSATGPRTLPIIFLVLGLLLLAVTPAIAGVPEDPARIASPEPMI
jgi:EmrB/QacA subfamily drug resistance transporter